MTLTTTVLFCLFDVLYIYIGWSSNGSCMFGWKVGRMILRIIKTFMFVWKVIRKNLGTLKKKRIDDIKEILTY